MSENSKFNFLIFVFAGLAVLGYASYFVWSEMIFAERFYIEKKGELISLEKKQEQIAQLQEELKKISENRIEVIDSLIIKDDVLKVIERIEAVAKRVLFSSLISLSILCAMLDFSVCNSRSILSSMAGV